MSNNNLDYVGNIYRHEGHDTLNLTLYTDGGELSKSSKRNHWPILSCIKDLPPVLEKSIDNVIWWGSWY